MVLPNTLSTSLAALHLVYITNSSQKLCESSLMAHYHAIYITTIILALFKILSVIAITQNYKLFSTYFSPFFSFTMKLSFTPKFGCAPGFLEYHIPCLYSVHRHPLSRWLFYQNLRNFKVRRILGLPYKPLSVHYQNILFSIFTYSF